MITQEPALTTFTWPVMPTVHTEVSADDHESEPPPVPPEPVTVTVPPPKVVDDGLAFAVKVAWVALLIVIVTLDVAAA